MNSDKNTTICLQIIQLLQENAIIHFPAFPETFGRLNPKEHKGLSAPFGTDGFFLYYESYLLQQWFLHSFSKLTYLYLHTHLHCLCLHILQRESSSDWRKEQGKYDEQVRQMLPHFYPEYPSADDSDLLDSHELWPCTVAINSHDRILVSQTDAPTVSAFTQLSTSEDLLKLWKPSGDRLLQELSASQSGGKRGRSGGNSSEHFDLEEKKSIDYHRFLQRFAIPREEAILDMDSFDYIPYHFGLTHYQNMPFIEPLEYQEVNRLDELAIAIDTSGSCSGKIVRRFLEETWSILRQKENFFSRMRLHLIQCDFTIQEHRIITSAREWEELLPDYQVLGHGDTDFCPVFEFLDDLISRKEIRKLRGLLYFTDGDGIFPRHAPSYDTAFVFLNHELEKHEIPKWAIRLNLNLPDDF